VHLLKLGRLDQLSRMIAGCIREHGVSRIADVCLNAMGVRSDYRCCDFRLKMHVFIRTHIHWPCSVWLVAFFGNLRKLHQTVTWCVQAVKVACCSGMAVLKIDISVTANQVPGSSSVLFNNILLLWPLLFFALYFNTTCIQRR
jgi:hypothetical protein